MFKRTVFLFLIFSMMVQAPGVRAEELPPLPKGPLLLTSVTPEMLAPEFWISRLPNAHVPIKTPEELKDFNREIVTMIPDRVNVFDISASRSGAPVREQLELEYRTLKGRIFFGADGQSIPASLFEETIRPRMNITAVPGRISTRWGAAVRPASIRALPTDTKMLEGREDIEFDQLQFTLIKTWTPVAVLHESRGGDWYYVQAPYSRGWVHAEDIALFSDRDSLKKYVEQEDFLSVTGESVVLYSDEAFTNPFLRVSMGTVLPLAYPGRTETSWIVWLPFRQANGQVNLRKVFIPMRSDVTLGYLPYTQANVIRQAFKLLAVRYGWGGTYYGRDCSGFTHDVFLSLGVDMPRNSKEQAFVGTQLGHFTPFADGELKVATIRASTPAITLLRMPLHIMLYLGELNGHFYIIHSTWAERISMNSDEKNRINQVVVSDLSLNGNSYLGSLFSRIESVNEIN